MEVLEFMQHVRLAQHTSAKSTHALVIAVPTTATYFDALIKMDSQHVHRYL
jgi:hypothetical protein